MNLIVLAVVFHLGVFVGAVAFGMWAVANPREFMAIATDEQAAWLDRFSSSADQDPSEDHREDRDLEAHEAE